MSAVDVEALGGIEVLSVEQVNADAVEQNVSEFLSETFGAAADGDGNADADTASRTWNIDDLDIPDRYFTDLELGSRNRDAISVGTYDSVDKLDVVDLAAHTGKDREDLVDARTRLRTLLRSINPRTPLECKYSEAEFWIRIKYKQARIRHDYLGLITIYKEHCRRKRLASFGAIIKPLLLERDEVIKIVEGLVFCKAHVEVLDYIAGEVHEHTILVVMDEYGRVREYVNWLLRADAYCSYLSEPFYHRFLADHKTSGRNLCLNELLDDEKEATELWPQDRTTCKKIRIMFGFGMGALSFALFGAGVITSGLLW